MSGDGGGGGGDGGVGVGPSGEAGVVDSPTGVSAEAAAVSVGGGTSSPGVLDAVTASQTNPTNMALSAVLGLVSPAMSFAFSAGTAAASAAEAAGLDVSPADGSGGTGEPTGPALTDPASLFANAASPRPVPVAAPAVAPAPPADLAPLVPLAPSPPPGPTLAERQTAAKAEAKSRRRRAAFGFAATKLTGPLGLQGDAPAFRPTALPSPQLGTKLGD